MREFLYGPKGKVPLYRPKGAGHSAPSGRKRAYSRPGDPLLEAFEGWLNLRDNKNEKWYFETAMEMMPDMTGKNSDEVGAIMAAFRDHKNIYSAGIFLSAAYNLMDTNDIIFEDRSGMEIQLLGYKLKEGKRLILASDAGFRVGEDSEGIILNYGRCERLGHGSRGIIINYGNVPSFGWISGSILINFGETGSMGDGSSGLIINHGNARKIGRKSEPPKGQASPATAKPSPVQITGRVIAATDPEEYFGAPHIIIRESECREIPGLLEHIEGIRTGVNPYKKVDGRDDTFEPKSHSEIFSFLDGLDVRGDINRILAEAGRLPV